MILKTTIRPDRFWRIISGEKKEHRIPIQHIELTEKSYEVIVLTTSYSREALVEILHFEEDKQAGEYVFTLGKIKSTNNMKRKSEKKISNKYDAPKNNKKKYIQLGIFP